MRTFFHHSVHKNASRFWVLISSTVSDQNHRDKKPCRCRCRPGSRRQSLIRRHVTRTSRLPHVRTALARNVHLPCSLDVAVLPSLSHLAVRLHCMHRDVTCVPDYTPLITRAARCDVTCVPDYTPLITRAAWCDVTCVPDYTPLITRAARCDVTCVPDYTPLITRAASFTMPVIASYVCHSL